MVAIFSRRANVSRALFDILSRERFPQVEAETVLPGRAGKPADLPAELHLQLVDALAAQGINRLWTHQADCWQAYRRDEDFMVTTGTASGKSLCFNLPVLDALLRDAPCAGHLPVPHQGPGPGPAAPAAAAWPARQIEVATYDGDTPTAARHVAREKARVLLTNPDMIHLSLLPHHERWGDFFFNLQLRGHRRGPHLPRGVRQQRGQRAPPPAPGGLLLRRASRASSWRRPPSATPASTRGTSPASTSRT